MKSREKDWRFDRGLADQFPVIGELRIVISGEYSYLGCWTGIIVQLKRRLR